MMQSMNNDLPEGFIIKASGSETIHSDFHFKRSRVNHEFMEAMKYPLIMVCAGAGYGKTTAVYDFVHEYQSTTVWVQLSERDNVGARFWENFSHCMAQINAPFAESLIKLGFPDTDEKLKQYQILLRNHEDRIRRMIVFDDCHYIENAHVIRFVEEAIRLMPLGTTLFIISRSTPRLSIANLVSGNQVYNVSEDELRFTESELAQYFLTQGISLQPDILRSIWGDTEGWAFALNYIVRSYKKAPGYEGYLRNAMKSNIFKFMETEVWDFTSKRLQNFLVRLSLIDHLSVELIMLLAGSEPDLVEELEKQNAYVRRDNYINAFLIHPLFLEFLAAKQELLSPEQKRETYTIAGSWCNQNGFKIDALSYYEKISDYRSIVIMFIGSPAQIPYDISCYAAAILDRTPLHFYDTVTYLASTHLRTIICQGRLDEANAKAAFYEARYIDLPFDDPFRRSTLSSVYYCWATVRRLMCVSNDVYDSDIYYEKLSKCYTTPIDPGVLIIKTLGPWICAVGSSRKGSPHDYIDSLIRSGEHLVKCFTGFETGEDELAWSELKLYQGDIQAAEGSIMSALNLARRMKKPAVIQKALFYILRIAVLQGNYQKANQALIDMKNNLDDEKYYSRFVDYDASLCWYYCILGFPEKAPDWLKENFSIYAHAGFVENSANQMKGRHCYASRNYRPLLSYIKDMRKRESYLFGRIEMFAMEACIHYKLKDREKACAVLEEAYNNAADNEIVLPFYELGKDMRTLTSYALKETKNIPKEWLVGINRKSASYAKRLAHVVTDYKQANNMLDGVVISPRESEILTDLSHGLSRTEIAASRGLSINTVKMLINNIYVKLGAENLPDAIRIAAERKIV